MENGLWEHATYAGDPVTFLVCDPNGNPLRAMDYLLSLRKTLSNTADTNSETAAAVYRPLPVQVSLLEDADAVPCADRIDEDSALDEWSPLHLAIVMRDTDTVAGIVEFHQQHAAAVINDCVARGVSLLASEDVVPQRLFVETRPELSGAVVLLGENHNNNNKKDYDDEDEDDEDEDEVDDMQCVTAALRPLLAALLHERATGDTAGFATTVVRSHVAHTAASTARPAGLLLESDVLHDVCGGDLRALTALLQCFDGLLVPVLRGQTVPSTRTASRSSSTCTTPWSTPHVRPSSRVGGGEMSCGPQLHRPPHSVAPFIVSCAPQELQRLALIAMWISHRESAAHERPASVGAGRQNREATVLSDFRASLWTLKKSCHVIPACSVWSGQLFILSRLVARDCELEAFLDIAEGGDCVYFTASIPAAFVTMAVAGAVVAAFPLDWRLIQMLHKRVDTLLVDVPRVFSPLRHYVASRPRNDAERFNELWIAKTPHAPLHKFNSRAEMLSFATVETVLRGAEKAWGCEEDHKPDAVDRAKALQVLQEWVNMCHKFFLSLRDRPPARRSASRHRHCEPSLSESFTSQPRPASDSDEHDTDVLHKVCVALPLRLRHGAAPSPLICDALFPGDKQMNLEKTETDEAIVKASLDEDFEAAQVAFGLIAGQKSNEIKLKFYGLYKQALVGDVNISRPWLMDTTGRAKWDAWNTHKGMDREEAKRLYVAEFQALHQHNAKTH